MWIMWTTKKSNIIFVKYDKFTIKNRGNRYKNRREECEKVNFL